MTTSPDVGPSVRAAAVCGGLSALLFLLALGLAADAPGVDAPAPEVAAYAAAHGTVTPIVAVTGALATVLTVAFAALLADVLRADVPGGRAALSVGTHCLSVAMALVLVGFLATALLGSGHSWSDPARAQLLNDAVWVSFALSGPPTACACGAFGSVMLRSRAWRAAAWLAGVVVLAHLAVSVSLADSGPWAPSGTAGTAAPVLFVVWTALICVTLLRTGRRRRVSPAVEEAAVR